MTLAGLSSILALLAFLIVQQTPSVHRSTVTGPTRRSMWVGTALTALTVALVGPRLLELLV